MKKGDFLDLNIESYAFEGKGLARVPGEDGQNFVVFVNGSYPGDKVKVQIRKKKRSYAEAKIEKILVPSKGRIDAKCSYFGTCGGCKQQDLKYSVQVKYKEEQVRDVFERLGGFENFEKEPVVA